MSDVSFDVSREPCIPVLRNGAFEQVSLRDALLKAHELSELQSELPTIEFGLYRLLIALMGDIFFVEAGEKLNTQRLSDLILRGRFDESRVVDYFAKYEDRFDLFSSKRPFLQTAGLDDREKPLAGLIHPIPSGTNATVFHHAHEEAFAVSPAVALGLLSSIAPLMTAGGAGLSPSINGAPPIYVLVRGKNLFETLCLNLCALPLSLARAENDAPSWRWTRSVGGERTSAGYLESLTWMPRRIRLVASDVGVCHLTGRRSDVLVRTMHFVAGDSTRLAVAWRDPNAAYRFKDDKAIILRMREGRALWRDIAPLTVLEEKNRIAVRPNVVNQFAILIEVGGLPSNRPLELDVFGMRTDMKMKIFEWQRDRLRLPNALILAHAQDANFGVEIQLWQDNAETAARSVTRAIKSTYPREGQGNDKAFGNRTAQSERRYWEILRSTFEDLLHELAALEVKALMTRQPLRERWRKEVEKAARGAFNSATDDIDVNAHALERVTRARRSLESSLKRVFDPQPIKKAALKHKGGKE